MSPIETCVALDADHVHMTKFYDSTHEVYQLIVELIREVRYNEPKKIAEAGIAGSFQQRDDLTLGVLGLMKDDEQFTIDPKGM